MRTTNYNYCPLSYVMDPKTSYENYQWQYCPLSYVMNPMTWYENYQLQLLSFVLCYTSNDMIWELPITTTVLCLMLWIQWHEMRTTNDNYRPLSYVMNRMTWYENYHLQLLSFVLCYKSNNTRWVLLITTTVLKCLMLWIQWHEMRTTNYNCCPLMSSVMNLMTPDENYQLQLLSLNGLCYESNDTRWELPITTTLL